jgi:hypothetical protein
MIWAGAAMELKIPNPKLQHPMKLQAPSLKPTQRCQAFIGHLHFGDSLALEC